jgi:acetyltransferase-like isoleucine patch superfamily enzyme
LASSAIDTVARKLTRLSARKVALLLYSALLRRRFQACGRGVRIHPPIIVNAPERIRVGNDVSIFAHCWLNSIDDGTSQVALSIGDGCSIGRFGHINAYEDVVLEDHVLIADRVHISDCSHEFEDDDVPVIRQGASFKGAVRIGRGAWIGTGAVIVPGVTVGRNAIVGANAVVTCDVPDNHIAVGVPARVMAKRKDRAYANQATTV